MSAAPALSAALALAEEYGFPVFPCRSKDEIVNGEERKAKSPLTVHGFKEASTNLAQIEEWWQRWPDALIGVPTGAKLFVVDVDPAGATWYHENATRLACARVHKTRRGWHLVYRMPAVPLGNTTSKLAAGIDTRGVGGYAVWWPAHGCEATGGLEDLTEPPEWVVKALTEPERSTAPKANGTGIQQGSRNDALTSLAGKMRRAGASQGEIEIALGVLNGRCELPLAPSELHTIAQSVARYAPGEGQDEAPLVLRHIADIVAERREARWLGGLRKILEHGVLAVLAGSRNTFKSFIAHHWLMLAALSGEPVVALSAEGAGLDRRTDAWMRTHAPAVDLRTLRLLALERAVNLNSASTLEALRAAIDAHAMVPTLVTVDTYSKYAPGLDENDNSAVAFYLASLGFELRDHYGCTLLLVAHAGHADARRPRGASVLMANPDAEYIVERPDAATMAATVTRERFKDSAALPPLAYSATVVDLGRCDSHGEPVTSLVLHDADVPAALAARRPELHGRAQRQLLAALRAQATDGAGIWTLADIREIGRKAGLAKGSARSAAEALSFTPHLTATVGGWRVTEVQG